MIVERRDGGGVRRNSQLFFSLILKSPLRKYTRKESCKVRAEMCLLSRDDQELVKNMLEMQSDSQGLAKCF